MADVTVQYTSLSASNSLRMFSPSSGSGESWSGNLTSSFISPSSVMSEAMPSSLMSHSEYEVHLTTGCVMVCDVGEMSMYFLPVKMSMPVMLALAWPCLPVLDVVMLMILHGWSLSMACMPFFSSPARRGTVSAAPEEVVAMS